MAENTVCNCSTSHNILFTSHPLKSKDHDPIKGAVRACTRALFHTVLKKSLEISVGAAALTSYNLASPVGTDVCFSSSYNLSVFSSKANSAHEVGGEVMLGESSSVTVDDDWPTTSAVVGSFRDKGVLATIDRGHLEALAPRDASQ
jgi:hypothetical protein